MGKKTDKLIAELEKIKDMPSAADRDPSLRYVRSVSMNVAYPKIPGQCRRCAGPLPPKKRAWCSQVCVTDALIRCDYIYASKYVIRHRDKGVCASCGLDVRALMKSKSREELVELGFTPGTRGWETDHIIPVVEGGGHCTLDNLRTLCTPCHKACTKQLMARLRSARKDAAIKPTR